MSTLSLGFRAPLVLLRDFRYTRKRAALVGGAFLIYAGLYGPLYALIGAMVGSLGAIPALIGGWLLGIRGGLAATLVLSVLTPLLTLAIVGKPFPNGIADHLIGDGLTLGVACAVGWLSKLLLRVRTQTEMLAREQHHLRELVHEWQQAEERYHTVMEISPDAIILSDIEGVVQFCNPAAALLHGYAYPDELIGQNAQEFIGPGDHARTMEQINEHLHGNHSNMIEYALQRSDGGSVMVEAAFAPVLDPAGLTKAYVTVVRDITERRHFEQQLHYQAFHDALTDLPNRALFMDRLEHALTREGRHPQSLAVLFLDLDRFKVINDSLGHEAGDGLLVAVARRLVTCIRPQDTVARLGGDEFTILLEDRPGVGEAAHVAERILAVLEAPFLLEGRELFISASIGVVFWMPDHLRPTDLMRDADVALYRAKNKGKGRYEIFDVSMNAHALDRLELENQLRRAVEREEFEVYYQPQVDLATDRVVGLEALVRWVHPERGLIPPAIFIPLAEETGLICALGQWVLTRACRHAQQWQHDYGRHAPPLTIAVNLSAREFQQPDLVTNVERIIQETGVDPQTLQLEITESVLMDEAEAHITTLRNLKRLGVRLAVDDFGTGYSSLSYLKRFPVDTLKIDGTFVADLASDTDNQAIVRAVIGLGHALQLEVIAEGVETSEDARHLRALGCEVGQGHYFARPMSSQAVGEFLAARVVTSRPRLALIS